jgi:hypothetical protein
MICSGEGHIDFQRFMSHARLVLLQGKSNPPRVVLSALFLSIFCYLTHEYQWWLSSNENICLDRARRGCSSCLDVIALQVVDGSLT